MHDVSGNHNDGRLGSSRSTDGRDADWVKGLFGIGSALRFDGNDYISIPDDKSLHQQRLTVEAWAKRDGSPGQFKYIVSKGGDNCEAASYGLYSSLNGGIAFYVYDGKKWYRSPQGSPKIWDGAWHHIAGTYDGKTVRLFVDGRRQRHAVQRQDQVRAAHRRRRDRRLPRVLQADAERDRRRGADLDARPPGQGDLGADQLRLEARAACAGREQLVRGRAVAG